MKSVKEPKRGRPENPRYRENISIDASLDAVAKSIMKRPPMPESEWRYLKSKPR